MDTGLIFNKSAFKHGLTEADIEWAFLHPIRNGLLKGYANKYLLVGLNTSGNPIEIMYNRIDEEQVNIFHAMKCRKRFLPRGIPPDMYYYVSEAKMAYMTEEEADALDEELTRTTPEVDFSKPDIYIRQRELLNVLKPVAADYIMTRALATHRSPAQVIGELVEARIAAAV